MSWGDVLQWNPVCRWKRRIKEGFSEATLTRRGSGVWEDPREEGLAGESVGTGDPVRLQPRAADTGLGQPCKAPGTMGTARVYIPSGRHTKRVLGRRKSKTDFEKDSCAAAWLEGGDGAGSRLSGSPAELRRGELALSTLHIPTHCSKRSPHPEASKSPRYSQLLQPSCCAHTTDSVCLSPSPVFRIIQGKG